LSTTFVVPCYQEVAALAAFAPLLPDLEADEIIFVDDGSRDGTGEALRTLAAGDGRVLVKTHARNRGVGAAMRTGIAASRGSVVVVYDADRTYPLQDAKRLIAALGSDLDVVTATPFGEAGSLQGVPAGRRFLSRAAAWAYRLALGRRARGLTVFTCAFRAWRGEFVRSLDWRSDGFPAAAEMFGRAILRGARVAQEPSCLGLRAAGESKMRVLPTALGHLAVLGGLLRRRLGGAR